MLPPMGANSVLDTDVDPRKGWGTPTHCGPLVRREALAAVGDRTPHGATESGGHQPYGPAAFGSSASRAGSLSHF